MNGNFARWPLVIGIWTAFHMTFLADAGRADEHAAADAAAEVVIDTLEEGFLAPPDACKPWAYWWWVYGNVTRESITRDLEGMKAKGFGGLLLFDARGYHDHIAPPPSRLDFMSPQWRELVQFSMQEAQRLGLEMSVNLSSCAGTLTGPWPVGNDAPKQLVWDTMPVTGPKSWEGPVPSGQWDSPHEVALLAARHATQPDDTQLVVEVLDLADHVTDGTLKWQVPAGQWTVIRFAATLVPGRDHDVDILDADAVERHFQRMGGRLLQDAGSAAGSTLTHLYNVSWEGVAAAWSLGLVDEFKQRRGYDLRDFLPVLAGLTVESPAISQRFLRDFQQTLAESFMENFYGRTQQLCHAAGLQWHSESGGPWDRKLPIFAHADQLAFLGRTDMPQGEFWHPYRPLNRPVAMAAHIYGKQRAATEAFTHMTRHFSVYPELLKPSADRAFCEGINHFIWHTFSASPSEFGLPGIHYWAGSHLNPNVTWWEQSGDFLTYLARCQFLLQQGLYVADVCVYTGDAPYQHWGRGEKWSTEPSLVLGRGYAYDLINTEVLLQRLNVQGDRLVLPGGMSYRALVVDLEQEELPPAALRRILELAEAGATIILGSRQPQRATGLSNYPNCDQQVRELTTRLWQELAQSEHASSPGKVLRGENLDELLRSHGVLADFEGPFDYVHRRGEQADIYFVAGAGRGECVFRVTDREPELWDPVSGGIRDAVQCRRAPDGRTVVPLELPANGSVFVVFRRPAQEASWFTIPESDGACQVLGRGPNGVQLQFWKNGDYALVDSRGTRKTARVQQLPAPLPLAGPWTVRFEEGRGAPESIEFPQLVPWNQHPLESIRYFSGTAGYSTTFTLTETQAKGLARLQLDQVKNVAEIRVNGHPLGVLWTAPWSVDVSAFVRPGENNLEVDVTNLWVNRLIGDARLPADQRWTAPYMRLESDPSAKLKYRCEGYLAKDELEPSGWWGSARLEFGEARDVTP